VTNDDKAIVATATAVTGDGVATAVIGIGAAVNGGGRMLPNQTDRTAAPAP
jgi:hypothetical protein